MCQHYNQAFTVCCDSTIEAFGNDDMISISFRQPQGGRFGDTYTENSVSTVEEIKTLFGYAYMRSSALCTIYI
jgi:hypothetical protein